ncbi:hypothetical protein A2129_02215 [Candidatus Woesebacteria bacterium GWC1_42_13]|uniref:MotA/TolQ/ExbB proton channel domain-containing protein n=2 Tax=Candidatus Woeseibacteriota TaxID=1752722 RepID=A0A1F7WX55_9BACT|nr:MAG: hypothetical protein A2112_00380 [Candidatus Woesebacteria bacterium GWA1_42_12]OGM06665.1 MAG: hypothetical protein A2129_02215 [Candidatus Woesebacteria bacterium GWC1_42_13]
MIQLFRHLTGEARNLQKEAFKQLLTLSTSAFGLVAALAWNEFITEFVETYIRPIVGTSSKLVSSLIYAVLITIFAVLVTFNLTKIVRKR